MIQLEEKLEKQLTLLMKEDKSFVIYQLPRQKEIRFAAQLAGKPQELYHLSDLNGKEGFVISPFRIDNTYPIVLIHPEIEISGLGNIVRALSALPYCKQQTESGNNQTIGAGIDNKKEKLIYRECFDRFIEPLKNGEFEKLVLSRSHRMTRPDSFSCLRSFLQAANDYPYMMNYLCCTPATGIWMGSTPEMILMGNANQWQTVALAGTKPADKLSDWDNKNIEEQEVVSEYIRNIIAKHTIETNEKGPYTAQAGNVAHLKTEFSFTLNDNGKIGSLLHDLHPTPAVCGIPKQEAFDFIVRNEAHNRKYYSGIIGRLAPRNETNLYVNLRCAEIDQSSITLYAGSGIMPASVHESEWEETNYKMQTLQFIFNKGRSC